VHPYTPVASSSLTSRGVVTVRPCSEAVKPFLPTANHDHTRRKVKAGSMDPANNRAAGAGGGRGLHSSAFQLNLSRFLSLTPPTDTEYPKKRAYVDPKIGRV